MQAEKARHFAERQMRVGQQLGNHSLYRKATIYLAYYSLFKKQFEEAKRIVRETMEICERVGDDDVFHMGEAALFQIEMSEGLDRQTKRD